MRLDAVLLAALTLSAVANAEEPAPDADLVLTLPMLYPVAPSPTSVIPTWDQAIATHSNVFLLSHYLVERSTEGIENGWLRYPARIGGAFLLDLLSFNFIGPGWAHEEGHRSVLGQYGLSSHNGANDPAGTWGGSYIPVYGLTDQQLSNLKRDHPADMVRLMSAGWETELLVRSELEKATFFHDRPGYEAIFYPLFSNLSTLGYLTVCLDQELLASGANEEIEATGNNVFLRDFTGPDCTAWTYDLHRPEEPYEARGYDETGLIRRLRLPSDMTPAEYSYLRRQRNLSLLNLIDPNLIGLSSFRLKLGERELRFGFSVQHLLTSFGSMTRLNLLADFAGVRGRAAFALFGNPSGYGFPGLEAEVYRFPLRHPLGTLNASAILALWLQPRDQRFDTTDVAPGAMGVLTLAQRIFDPVEVMVRVRAKTAGWAPGEARLGPMFDVAVGLNAALH